MDSVALVTALMAARMAQVQFAAAAKIMQSQPDGGGNAVSILTAAANANSDQLAAVANGIGQNVDISV